LVFSSLLYLIGSFISPKSEKTYDKLASYACGEEFPARKLHVDARRFFIYVTYFMIFDISAFILTTSFGHGFYPIVFSLIVFLAVVTMLSLWRREE
jgi:NADH:ubiquinone oxidoreductase subunit 3 (subunit A)